MTLADPSNVSVRELATSGALALIYGLVTAAGITWWNDLVGTAASEQQLTGEPRMYTLAASDFRSRDRRQLASASQLMRARNSKSAVAGMLAILSPGTSHQFCFGTGVQDVLVPGVRNLRPGRTQLRAQIGDTTAVPPTA